MKTFKKPSTALFFPNHAWKLISNVMYDERKSEFSLRHTQIMALCMAAMIGGTTVAAESV